MKRHLITLSLLILLIHKSVETDLSSESCEEDSEPLTPAEQVKSQESAKIPAQSLIPAEIIQDPITPVPVPQNRYENSDNKDDLRIAGVRKNKEIILQDRYGRMNPWEKVRVDKLIRGSDGDFWMPVLYMNHHPKKLQKYLQTKQLIREKRSRRKHKRQRMRDLIGRKRRRHNFY